MQNQWHHGIFVNSKTIMYCDPMSTWYALQQHKKLHNRRNNQSQFRNAEFIAKSGKEIENWSYVM